MYMYILVNLLFHGPQKVHKQSFITNPIKAYNTMHIFILYLRVLDNSMMLQCIYHNNSDQFINEIVSNK